MSNKNKNKTKSMNRKKREIRIRLGNGEIITRCYDCPSHREYDNRMGGVMCCHPAAKSLSIISEPEDSTGFPYECPLVFSVFIGEERETKNE